MGRDKKNEARVAQFVKYVVSDTELPAWKALSAWARLAYLELKKWCIVDGKFQNNNGEIFRSPRKLAEDLGCSEKTASAALADLQAKGWIVCTNLPHLGIEGKGKTATFRLTMFSTGDFPRRKTPTNDPKTWEEGQDYEVTVYSSYKPKPRKGRSKNFQK